MASSLSSSYKSKADSLLADSLYFQRRKGRQRVKKKKKKIRLKFTHIIFYLFFIGGIFFFIQQAYLFLISWNYLNIKKVTVFCTQQKIEQEITRMLSQEKLGNILLVDLVKLRQTITAHHLVKEARVRKIFPSYLKVVIRERKPFAVIRKNGFYLVDEEGVLLQKTSSFQDTKLPLLIDSQNFARHYEQKISLAWECLKSLPSSERNNIKILDLSSSGWILITFKKEPTKIKLAGNFARNVEYYRLHKDELEDRFGRLDYIDLRFDDRIYLKPAEETSSGLIPGLERRNNNG